MQSIYCSDGVFTAPLHSNEICSIVACVFVAAGMYSPNRCLAIHAYCDYTLLAFGRHVTLLPPKSYSFRMIYRRAAISPFLRAVLATSMIGLFFLPVAQFSRCLLSNRYRCSLLKSDRPERLPDKVPILPNLSPSSCLSYR
jgi:hypothetical protein